MKRALVVLVVLLAAIVTGAALAGSTATASGASTFQLRGYEVMLGTNSGTFLGYRGSLPTPDGYWVAVINHGSLDTHPHAVTTITGGQFTLVSFSGNLFSATPFAPTASVTITGGTVVAGPVVRGHDCMQDFQINGSLPGDGTFTGTLTHLGTRDGGSCVPELAVFSGSVTLPTTPP